MINTPTKSTGAMNHSSILALNVPAPQSVKNQGNIMTLIKNQKNGGYRTAPQAPYNQRQGSSVQQNPYNQRQGSSAQQAPYNQRQSSSAQQNPYNQRQSSSAPARPPRQPQNIQPALSAGQQNTAGTPGMPAARPIPALQNKVQKGQKTLLSTAPLTAVDACFGWNVTDARCDVDVSAFLLGADGRVIGDSWFVFYGQTLSPDKSTRFVEGGSADREMIQIDFTRLDPQVRKIVFVLTINDALADRLHFGMLKDAYVRVMDHASGRELVSFLMTEYYSNIISMMTGELYLHNGVWKFNAVGNGVAKDLEGLCALYGVQVV